MRPPQIQRIDPATLEPPPAKTLEKPNEEFEPKYVAVRTPRSWSTGRRNLVWGVVLLLICVPLFGWALHLGGPATAMTLVTCLATVTTLYVASRARLFRQRNGGFLALSIVCMVAVSVALTEQGWLAATRPAVSHEAVAASIEPTPAASKAPAAQPAALPPSLVDALMISTPDPTRGPRVRILKNSQVPIDGQTYLIRAGDLFPYVGQKDGEVQFLAGSQQIALRQDLVEILKREFKPEEPEDTSAAAAPTPVALPAPSPEAARREAASRQEAVHRYPGIAVKDSPENKAFIQRYNEMKAGGLTEFFQNPDWPLLLAEGLAKAGNWQRQDIIEDAPATDSSTVPAAAPKGVKRPANSGAGAGGDTPQDADAAPGAAAPADAPPTAPAEPAPAQ